jgi:hypothetical protein
MALALTIIGGAARLLPHPPNFTPVGGMSLFAGARLRGWKAYLTPLLLMATTDVLLTTMHGHSLIRANTPAIYGSFLISVWIGRRIRAKATALRVGAAASICSMQFFLLTNLAVWLWSGMYPLTAAGLIACYAAALPFFGRTLAGDLFYSAALFGVHGWLSRRAAPAAQPARA